MQRTSADVSFQIPHPVGWSVRITRQQKEQKKKEQKEEGKKDVVVHELPCGGITIASADGFGVKEFCMGELETTIQLGAALEETRSGLWDLRSVGFHGLRSVYFFQIDNL